MPDHDRWPPGGGDPSLNEINRIDRFLDALGTNQRAYSTDRDEAELAFLLADWRDGIRDAPLTAVVTTKDAAAALQASRSSRRTRTSLALVGSAAAAVLCLGGFGTAVYGAHPGDSLYGVRSMLFGEQQARNDQVSLASAELDQVQHLIDQGQWQQAQDKLVALSSTVQSVDQPQDQQDLAQKYNTLTYKVIQQDPAATLPPPGEPLPVLPSSPLTLLPVQVFDQTSTFTTTSVSTNPATVPPVDTTSTTTTSTTTSSDSPSTTTSPSTSTSTSTPPPSTTTPPSASTTTTTAPATSSSTSTPPPASTPPSTATTTTTTTTVVARDASPPPASAPPAASAPPSASAPPPSQPRVAPSAPPVEAPVVETPQPTKAAPPAVAPAPEVSSPQREAPPVVTTTVPRSGGAGE